MIFKTGFAVEVLKRDKCGISWFKAKILGHTMENVPAENKGLLNTKADGHIEKVLLQKGYYMIQYEHLFDSEGVHLTEKVSAETVRPGPPPMEVLKNPDVGDLVECFENQVFKRGKLIRVLPHRVYVVKYFGSNEERTVQLLNMRPLLSWKNDKWVHDRKEFKSTTLHNYPTKPELELQLNITSRAVTLQKKRATPKNKDEWDESCGSCAMPENDAAYHFIRKKRKNSFNAPLLDNGDEAESSASMPSCDSSRILCGCSIFPLNNRRYGASSFHDCQNTEAEALDKDQAAKIHKLELDAYHSTLRAFYASGSLDWQKTTLLFDLRTTLHISNDEHLLEIRSLLGK